MTDDGAGCIRLDALPTRETFELGQDVDNPAQPIANGWMSTSGAGAATQVEIEGLSGPATVAGITVTLDEGEKLFLTVSPLSEQFHGHGSHRTPGWMGFTDLAVDLPVVD